MPEEILAITIVAIVFGSVVTIVKSVLSYRERTRFGVHQGQIERTSSAQGTSVTTSELQQMMRDAVSDATAPLQSRLDALEARAAPGPMMQDDADPAESEPVRKTIGNRVQ